MLSSALHDAAHRRGYARFPHLDLGYDYYTCGYTVQRARHRRMGGSTEGSTPVPQIFDAVIVGAGFAGLYMLYRMRKSGRTAIVIERGTDVGGTWYWNRYPGARCDVESYQYSYSFSPELDQQWTWSERFAPQPEIQAYAAHVADRFDLRKDIRFERTVVSADFSEKDETWLVRTRE